MEPLGNAEFDYGALSVEELTREEAEALGARLEPDDPTPPEPPPFDEPDARTVREPRRRNGANSYEKKLGDVNRALIKTFAKRRETLPDAAVLILEGPDFCKAWGNAAAEHDKIGRAIDWLSEPTDNPLLLALAATAPIALQMFRNHEPFLQPQPRGLRVPRIGHDDGGKLGVQWRNIKLPKIGLRLQNVPAYTAATNDPQALVRHVFGNADVIRELKKQGIDVAPLV